MAQPRRADRREQDLEGRTDKTLEQEQLADANAVLEDYRRLAAQIVSSKDELARGKRENLVPEDVAADETQRLDELAGKVASDGKAVAADRQSRRRGR